MKRRSTIAARGFSMVEVVITLAIVVTLAAIFLITMAGSRAGDKIDRGAAMIHNDLVLIRSLAVSTNTSHRLNWLSTVEWKVESHVEGATPPNDWTQVGAVRHMPSDTYLTNDSLSNAKDNLWATSRGLYEFNGCESEPYVTVQGFGVSKAKSINVFIGGALNYETN